MESNRMEIRYTSPSTGYVTEVIDCATPQGAINLLKARIPNLSVSAITYLPSQPTDPRDGNRR
jgi:hypothetical protein